MSTLAQERMLADFDAELAEGNRLAKLLAEHVERMSAGKAEYAYDVYGTTYTVLVLVNEPIETETTLSNLRRLVTQGSNRLAAADKLVAALEPFRKADELQGPEAHCYAAEIDDALTAYREASNA